MNSNFRNLRVLRLTYYIEMTTRYLLTSESAIKVNVVKDRLKDGPIVLDCVSIPSDQITDNVEQPVGIGGLICCKNRILAALFQLEAN